MIKVVIRKQLCIKWIAELEVMTNNKIIKINIKGTLFYRTNR